MRALVLLFIFACGLLPAMARVGETLDQCKKRYGKAIALAPVYDFGTEGRDLAYYSFEKNGIDIQIGFLNGKAADLSFRHHEFANGTAGAAASTNAPGVPDTSGTWTQVEIDTLLAANSGGQAWKTVTDGKLIFFPNTPSQSARYGAYQQRDDGVMSTNDGSTLHIFTPEWMSYINASMQAHLAHITEDQKKNLEGF